MRLTIILIAVTLAPQNASAQIIRGRLFLPDSVTPAPGIIVTAIGPAGATAARVLSTTSGNYLLQLKTPGTYEVRALRIGFRPSVARVTVTASSTTVQNIVLSFLPVAIDGVDVRDKDDCSLKGRDGQTFLQLWEQARGALTATRLWEESGTLDVRLIRAEGHVDAPQSFNTDSVYEIVDTLHARESITDRAFAATPPETIAARGYVRARPDGRTVFDLPNAETLLSDDFVGGHCFSIRKSSEHTDWIGLGFTPRRTKDGIADIRGVLWLDRTSADLRRLEFTYINLPPAEYRVCDEHPFVKLTPELMEEVPKFEQPKPSCYTEKNRSNHLGLGGRADFVRLPTGEWLVANWLIRTPPDEGRIRPGQYRVRMENRVPVHCYYGPDCHRMFGMRARLVTIMGTISRVTRDGTELYRDDSKDALISVAAEKRAGGHPAAIEGSITDTDGNPLLNAVIQVTDPGRVTLTDSIGAFRLLPLPANTVTVLVRCHGYTPVQFRVHLLRDSTHRATLSLPRDTVRAASVNCATNGR